MVMDRRLRIALRLLLPTSATVFLGLVAAAHTAQTTCRDCIVAHLIEVRGAWCDQRYQECSNAASDRLARMSPVRRDSQVVRIGKITGNEFIRVRSHINGKSLTFD